MKNGKRTRLASPLQFLSGVVLNKAMILAGLLLGAALTINQAGAQDYGWVKAQLDWAAGDHGFNEGGQCGVNALQGIAGVPLPNVPFEYQILGNVWDRTNMMNAAQSAFRMGFVDAAVNAAICSQVHNGPVHDALAKRRDLIASLSVRHPRRGPHHLSMLGFVGIGNYNRGSRQAASSALRTGSRVKRGKLGERNCYFDFFKT